MRRISDKERMYLNEVLESEFRSSAGSSMSKRLEDEFALRFGVKYAIAHINGTATLHSALSSMGVGYGDEVIVPPLTMASTTFAVLQCNAIPIFADVNEETFNIDPECIRKKVSNRTRAIIPVSLYGLSADLDPIMDIAKENNIMVLEDDAQCLLGYYNGKLVGTSGDMASFSFQSSKHLTSGEGGMVITNDVDLALKVRRFNSLGYAGVGARKGAITKEIIQDPKYKRHVSMGYNYRMPELCAAVALGQFEHLDELVEQRKKIAKRYDEVVQQCNWLLPQRVPVGYTHSYWTYAVKLDVSSKFSWYDFRKKYMENGGDGIYAAWELTYREPFFESLIDKNDKHPCPIAEILQPNLLQFKTNYFMEEKIDAQVRALEKTIHYFDSEMFQ